MDVSEDDGPPTDESFLETHQAADDDEDDDTEEGSTAADDEPGSEEDEADGEDGAFEDDALHGTNGLIYDKRRELVSLWNEVKQLDRLRSTFDGSDADTPPFLGRIANGWFQLEDAANELHEIDIDKRELLARLASEAHAKGVDRCETLNAEYPNFCNGASSGYEPKPYCGKCVP